jgi:hypothetical protein
MQYSNMSNCENFVTVIQLVVKEVGYPSLLKSKPMSFLSFILIELNAVRTMTIYLNIMCVAQKVLIALFSL